MPTYGTFAPTHGQTLGTVVLSGFDFPMQIIKFDWQGINREPIEVTNMNVLPTDVADSFGNRMYIPSAYVDPGIVVLQILHDPTLPIAPIIDPNDSGPQTVTVHIGPAGGEAFVCLGFAIKYEIDGPLDGKALTATIHLKLTDSVSNLYLSDGACTATPV